MKEEFYEFPGGDTDDLRLVGSQCLDCGERHFPEKLCCPNCSSRQLDKVILSETGVIDTYTVVRQTAPTWKGPVPYIIVAVMLDDGVKVTSHLIDCDPEQVKIGSRVKTVAGKLREDEEGNEIIAHMFKIID